MPRPTKIELLSRFFPEIRNKSTKADKEAAIAYNTLAAEVILADQLRLYDNGRAKHGPGVLCVRLHNEAAESAYLPLRDIQIDLDTAKSQGHTAMETFFKDLVAEIARINPDKAGLVLLVDKSSAQLFPIDREYPARTIEALLQEFSA